MVEYEDSVANHLSRILHSDSYNVVISSATYAHMLTDNLQTDRQTDRLRQNWVLASEG